MTSINPNIIFLGVFGAMLIIFGSVVFFANLLSPANKAVSQRLTRFKERYKANKSIDASRRLQIYSRDSNLEDLLKRILPRPAELRQRLNRTGKAITLGQFAAANGIATVIFTLLLLLASGFPAIACLFGGIFLGIGLPHMSVNYLINKRQEKFLALFPEAIDLIVRGLKSGLPVIESINAVSREMDDPVGTEFRRIADDIRFGKTMTDSLWSATERLSVAEFKFFVISLSVQQETGGNLAETLGNLSGILRSRQQMKLKIRAMSSEGRASAMIIGSLPFIMYGLILVMNPEYGAVLYTDPRAQMVAVGALIWMGIGMLMIKKMISFEI
ncbi:type II secretion system F family protein [Govanella unica]|uniref:Type II secretion system F family protein n=1 Tax=Govanella unica TaxID=2975056 RepID=A0A9X3U048_9PROT|nr:type II secretion system F family protein [Govania unica]MDA5194966.1 type II secretion system F family protein [Govania unica]